MIQAHEKPFWTLLLIDAGECIRVTRMSPDEPLAGIGWVSVDAYPTKRLAMERKAWLEDLIGRDLLSFHDVEEECMDGGMIQDDWRRE